MSQSDGENTKRQGKPKGVWNIKGKGRFHRLPERSKVSRILINLPSFIFHRQESRVEDSSITMTIPSVCLDVEMLWPQETRQSSGV